MQILVIKTITIFRFFKKFTDIRKKLWIRREAGEKTLIYFSFAKLSHKNGYSQRH